MDKIYRLMELPKLSPQFADIPLMRGHIEVLEPLPTCKVHVKGWTLLLDTELQAIEVHYGGQKLKQCPLFERPDVGAHYPWIQHSSKVGFEFILDVGDIERSGGAGMLEIVGLSKEGTPKGMLSQLVRSDIDRFPSPPEENIYRSTHGRTPHLFKVGALKAFGDFVGVLNRHVEWKKIRKIFDWGCGSGRLSVHFLSAEPSIELIGADIDPMAVEWCRLNISAGRYDMSPLMPPSQYENGEFDLIFSYSVFTHLRREVQEAWLCELHRVLKPSGWFLATTHGESAFQFTRQSLKPEWPINEFCDVADPVLNGIVPDDYYRATFQSEHYTRREFGKFFEIVEYAPGGAASFQDLVLMRKGSK